MAPSVLIAGAGPTGLVLALVLLQNNISVRIIEKEPTHRIGSRGSGIQVRYSLLYLLQPRTLELYDILGILPEIQQEGAPIPPMARYNPGEREPVAVARLGEWVEPTPDTPHANSLSLSQERHEAILRGCLQKLGCTVELGSELRGFEQRADHVVAHIATAGVEERTRFDWLVGADGGRSVVRKQLGLSFLGETHAEQSIALGDIVIEEGIDPGRWHSWSVPPKLCVVLLLRGQYSDAHSPFRVALRSNNSTSKVFMFAYAGRPAHLAETPLTRDEFIDEFYAFTGRRDVKFGETSWLSIYRPNLRMVDKMQAGRVFIAGDAAHCHSPTGGQGLNSSVQDAANLGWKLALVHKGAAPAALLETYSEERVRVVAQMLALTTTLYKKTFSQPGAAPDEDGWRRGGELHMLGVNYCGSSIVLEQAGAGGGNAYAKATGGRVQAAYRAPDAPGLVRVGAKEAPTRLFAVFRASVHTVLLFGGGGDAAARRRVVDVLARLPADAVQAVLVRPAGTGTAPEGDASAFAAVLEDREGHAHAGYGVAADELAVVVVRPDGVVGAVVSDAEGVGEYFAKILV
ncbi:FAD binding domain-containing protein [Mycena maculata]|uniref:FAD binding domain-containing protein n=1 Tax=Mycena maculata TaxID=230809 RepID=A0AAD7NWH7_9AGAR|nr:FAD binding domain-containing protein [Mycena maculata]